MLVAQRLLSHIGELDGAFTRSVHEPIATLRVELRGRDNFSELLHVCWLDVNNVEALILDVEVPQVYPQVVRADEGLAIAVHRYAVDVVGMCVGVDSSRDSGDNGVMMCHPRELEICHAPEVMVGISDGATSVCAWSSCRCEL